LLRERLQSVPIRRPIFVAGLARSGTTILLELLASLDSVVTHQYRDFPPVFTPYWWNWLVDRAAPKQFESKERAHGDRIEVTPNSPEAMEEPLWMTFFPGTHDPQRVNCLGPTDRNTSFDDFFLDHIRKLLLTREGKRYASKGNYNITRLQYLRDLFPDARFVIPIRAPAAHIASLMKQHKLFCEACKDNPRAVDYLRRVGHFEFGPDRRPINTGSSATTEAVISRWQEGDEVGGWALYWSEIYGYIANLLRADERVGNASMVVRYEDLCDKPQTTVKDMLTHCDIPARSEETRAFTDKISAPDYYRWPFSDEEMTRIWEIAQATAEKFGYNDPSGAERSALPL
jgi:hypothetical protein